MHRNRPNRPNRPKSSLKLPSLSRIYSHLTLGDGPNSDTQSSGEENLPAHQLNSRNLVWRSQIERIE